MLKSRNRLRLRFALSLVLSLLFAGGLLVGTASPAAAESCFGAWKDHAHSQGVARERVNYAFCDTGRSSWSINLTDTLCDNRSARVSWYLYDSAGLLASGSGTNGNGCNSTKTFSIGSFYADIQQLRTDLKACSWTCSSTETFRDYF